MSDVRSRQGGARVRLPPPLVFAAALAAGFFLPPRLGLPLGARLLLGGILNMIYYVPLISVTQRESPDHVRGRVMATRFLLVQGGYLAGMVAAGPMSDRFGAPMVFVVGGLFLIIAALLGFAFRSIRMATLRDDSSAVAVLKATASG